MCGVVGVLARDGDAASQASLALFALQHRGQESAGVAVSDGDQILVYKDLGLVAQVLDERRIPRFRGELAIAHCRYSTTGSTKWENAQPTFRHGPRRAVAVGHNGNLVNTRRLLELLPADAGMVGTSDTELLTALLAAEPGEDLVAALRNLLPQVSGAYALVVMDEGRIVGVRDPHGFRPLVLGRLPGEGGWVLASETAALDILAAEYIRDVEPGELVVIDRDGVRSERFAEGRLNLCVFELIYFARPDSYMLGRNLYQVRRRMGEALAIEAPVDADLVVPGARHRRAGGGRVRRGQRHPVRRGHGQEPIRRTDLHPAVAGAATARGDGQAQPPARGRARSEAGGRRRFHRPGHHDP